jgi:large subunit ribosomal protein L29
MAQVKASQLRDKSVDELRQQETDLRDQIFKLRFQKATGQAENPQRIALVRKELARVLTVLREKSAAAG